MKYNRFTLIILSIFLLSGMIEAQGWRTISKASFQGNFYDIFFINENIGWSVGWYGQIAKTTDGGQTWIDYSIDLNKKDLNSVFFFDELNGIACGDDRRIVKTNDGGISWQIDSLMVIPDPKADCNKIYFINQQRGWLLASLSTQSSTQSWLLGTSDGGITWSIEFNVDKELLNFDFYDATHGIISGKRTNAFYYTTDGVNWNNSTPPDLKYSYSRSDMSAIDMVSESIAYAAGWGNFATVQPTILLKTTDGGTNWIYLDQVTENKTYESISSVYFKDTVNGIAVGGGLSSPCLVLKTSDGGQNWKQLPAPYGHGLNQIFEKSGKLWICGDGGLQVYTTDFGNTWELVKQTPSGTLYNIQFVNEELAFASGHNGVLFKSTDGGENWISSYVLAGNTVLNAWNMHFVNDNIGFISQNLGKVSKTTDGGLSWNTVLPETSIIAYVNYGVHFLNENLGFVVGKLGTDIDVINKTTDGGKTWIIKSGILNTELFDVTFVNDQSGIIAGDNCKMFYTIDGGENWNISVINNVPTELNASQLKKVCFINSNTAIAVGQKIILKSTDAGASWEHVKTARSDLKGVSFHNEDIGYVAGTGELLRTTDQGITWEDITDSTLTGSIFSLCTDPSGNVWIGGTSSTIYTNKSQPVSVNDDKYKINDFNLSQNYPNPFNPSTKIKYNLAEKGFVSLKVYDALGRLVKTLVNKEQNAGEYNIDFNASGLTSGIYFYTLNVNGNLISRKMNLIK